MALDNAKNFAKSTLASGITSGATSLSVAAGTGSRFPTVPFNATIWEKSTYGDPSDDPNVEIVRVTSISSDTFTITRAQESTSAVAHNTAGKTYGILAGLTAKTINTDFPGELNLKQDTLVSGTNIKTINGSSVLGSGDLSVSASPGGSNTQVQYNNAGSLAGISGVTTDGTQLILSKLSPSSNSTTALQITQADKSTVVQNIDTTSRRIGINETAPSATFVVKGTANGVPVLFIDGTSGQSTYLLQIGKNGNGAYFRINQNGDITDISGSGARILGSGGIPYFPDGFTVTQIASAANSEAKLLLSQGPDYPFVFHGRNGGAGRSLVVRGVTSQSENIFEVCDVSFNPFLKVAATGGLGHRRLVTAKTTNYTVVNADSGTLFTNAGAAGSVNFTLPTAVAGLTYSFYVDANQTLTITAGSSTTIRNASTVSSSAGTFSTNTVGNFLKITAISTTQWICESITGTWTVT